MNPPPAPRWLPTDGQDPRSLTDERLQLHYGAWIVASVAHSLLPERDDDSHTNLGIGPDGSALTTRALDAEGAIRLGLELAPLALVLRRAGEEAARLALAGRSFDEALAWTARIAREHVRVDADVQRRDFPDFPDHPLASGARFEAGDPERRAVVGRWFANARAQLQEVLAAEPESDPLRVWPHHFDLGSVIRRGGTGDDARSIGVGLSPGDESYAEPYFYLSPWPYPDARELPALPGPGGWHTAGFTAAVLTASAIRAPEGPTAAAFLRDAMKACRDLTA